MSEPGRTLRISAIGLRLEALGPDWNPHCPEGQIRWGSDYQRLPAATCEED